MYLIGASWRRLARLLVGKPEEDLDAAANTRLTAVVDPLDELSAQSHVHRLL